MRRTRNKPAALGVCAGALLLSLAAPLRAADIRSLEVTRDGDAYRVVSTTFIAASPDSVYAVLADYDDYERISSIFQEARYVEPLEEGKGRVFTRVRGCILFFCQSVDRLEDITVADQRQITVEIVPDGSDLSSGVASWALHADDGGTRIEYRMDMVPDFWVPPVVGPYLVRRILAKGASGAADRVEHYARELDAR